jgi:hypothetical protein
MAPRTFALDAWVARAGRVSEGDAVALLDEFTEGAAGAARPAGVRLSH